MPVIERGVLTGIRKTARSAASPPGIKRHAASGLARVERVTLLTLEAIGPKGEELAMAAGERTGIPVGFDPEFECANFDSDALDETELQAVVFEALAEIDPSWAEHLRVAE